MLGTQKILRFAELVRFKRESESILPSSWNPERVLFPPE